MKQRNRMKEQAIHGTALIPAAIHRLSYPPNSGNFFYLHWHDEFEFIVVISGAIIYTVEDEEYCLQEGEGLFISSNQLHAARCFDNFPCEACVVLFHANLFGSDKQGATYTKFVDPILTNEFIFTKHLHPQVAWQKKVLDLLISIDLLHNERLSENELLLKGMLFEIWHHCFQNGTHQSDRHRNQTGYKLERMQPVLNYIHTCYGDELTLSALAKLLPMSEGQFCRAFKEVTNISPIAYVLRYRILQSCILLSEPDRKIADIAKSVGFNNISYFNREFIKAIGCSPSQYRKEI